LDVARAPLGTHRDGETPQGEKRKAPFKIKNCKRGVIKKKKGVADRQREEPL